MSEKTVVAIRQFLDSNKIEYAFKEHEEVRTSEEAARARGEDIKIGAKAMVLKCDDTFVMFILSAALKIDNKKVKELVGAKSLRFATPDEVTRLTDCIPGSVPPFPNLLGTDKRGIEFYVDESVFANEYMAFNCGERTKSIKMKTEDYKRLIQPRVSAFSAT
jgi:Ala-tRNA(Pro) deacylase